MIGSTPVGVLNSFGKLLRTSVLSIQTTPSVLTGPLAQLSSLDAPPKLHLSGSSGCGRAGRHGASPPALPVTPPQEKANCLLRLQPQSQPVANGLAVRGARR